MPSLASASVARACASSAAQTGHDSDGLVSAGIAASIRAMGACLHWAAISAGMWSRVMACTNRCISTRPFAATVTQRIPTQRRDRVASCQRIV